MDLEILIPIIIAVAVAIVAFLIWLKVGARSAKQLRASLPDLVQSEINNHPTLIKHLPLITEYVQNETLFSLAAGVSVVMKMQKERSGYVKCDDPAYDLVTFSVEEAGTVSASEKLGVTVGNREQMRALLGAFALCVKFICECDTFKGSTVEVTDMSTGSELRFDYRIG